jgi:hypothetical protein
MFYVVYVVDEICWFTSELQALRICTFVTKFLQVLADHLLAHFFLLRYIREYSHGNNSNYNERTWNFNQLWFHSDQQWVGTLLYTLPLVARDFAK